MQRVAWRLKIPWKSNDTSVQGAELYKLHTFVIIFAIVYCYVRGVFQKYAERFHRMFAVATRLMISHVKHAWYILIKYR